MKEQRKIVLELLESDKISKEEAFKLLEVIDNDIDPNSKNNRFERELRKLGKSLDKTLVKANKKYKEYQPKVKDVTEKTLDSVKMSYKKFKKKDINENDIFDYDDFN